MFKASNPRCKGLMFEGAVFKALDCMSKAPDFMSKVPDFPPEQSKRHRSRQYITLSYCGFEGWAARLHCTESCKESGSVDSF